jgi:nitrile hydratase accessory protein
MPPQIDSASLVGAIASLQAELSALPGDAQGPVFKAPWEAQAFAMTLALHQRGEFTWKEWAQTLAEVIAEVRQRGETDTGENYYVHWLTALERISMRKGLVSEALLQARRTQWEHAVRLTPHGKPIEL